MLATRSYFQMKKGVRWFCQTLRRRKDKDRTEMGNFRISVLILTSRTTIPIFTQINENL